MDIKRLKAMIADGKKVNFVRFRSNELIYTTECGFEFPVPVSKAGSGTFLAEDRASVFMRFIKEHLKLLDNTETQMNEVEN